MDFWIKRFRLDPSYIHSSLSSGKQRYYLIYSYNQQNLYSTPLLVSTSTKHAAPVVVENFTSKVLGPDSIELEWDNASENSQYMILRSEGLLTPAPVSGASYAIGESLNGATVVHIGNIGNFQDTELSPETSFDYYIYGINQDLLYSNVQQTTSTTLKAAPTTPTISSETIVPTSVGLSWGPVSEAAGYLVLKKSSSFTFTPTVGATYLKGSVLSGATVVYSGASLSAQDTNLTPGSQHYYLIFAYNADAVYSQPTTRDYTTQVGPDTPTIQGSAVGRTHITVAWDAANLASEYILVRSTSSLAGLTLSNTSTYSVGQAIGGGQVVHVGPESTFTDKSLSPGTAYHYALFSSMSGPLYSAAILWTDTTDTTVVNPVTSLTTSSGAEDIQLDWVAPAGANAYLILRATSEVTALPGNSISNSVGDINGHATVVYTGSATSFTDTNTNRGERYYYAVFSADASLRYSDPVLINQVSATYATSSLDSGFGASGVVHTDHPLLSNSVYTTDSIVDNDGRLIAVGYYSKDSEDSVAYIYRLNKDGSYDTNFNSTGIIYEDNMNNTQNRLDYFYAVAIDSNGKIITCGYTEATPGNALAVVARYHTDGSPDESFGTNGKAFFDSLAGSSGYDTCIDVEVNSAGNIFITGSTLNGTASDMYVVKLLTNGSLDTSFATAGVLIEGDIIVSSGAETGRSISLQTNGTFYVMGRAAGAVDALDWYLARYLADGSPDGSFGTSGVVSGSDVLGYAGSDYAFDMDLDSNGKIYIVGSANNSIGVLTAYVMRFNATGALDTTYNGTGVQELPGQDATQQSSAKAIEIDSQNKVLAGGYGFTPGGTRWVTIWRVEEDGSRDPNWFLYNIGAGPSDSMFMQISTLSVDESGYVYASGVGEFDSFNASATWRFD